MAGTAVVFGCDGELDWNAKGACPLLMCEAAILNEGQLDVYDEIDLEGGPVSEDGHKQLMVGKAQSLSPDNSVRFVHCMTENDEVVSAGIISERQYNAVRYRNEWL